MSSVVEELQKYDNTESLAALMLTDYVLAVKKALSPNYRYFQT
jgi:hypothetical protein